MALHPQSITEKRNTHPKHRLYETILSFPGLSEEEKRAERISQEAFVVLVAGSDTTARILTNGVFYVLSNKPTVLRRLQEDLLQVMPTSDSKPSWPELEKLPYLVRNRHGKVQSETLRH